MNHIRSARAPVGVAWRVLVALALAGAWAALPAAPAGASSLVGCTGSAQSLDDAGEVIDSAIASGGTITDTETGGAAATRSNPFVVDTGGTVIYQGQSDTVITDHSWSVQLLGVDVLSGGSANAGGQQAADGSVDLADKLPFPIVGLVRVSGQIEGTGGTCTGDGYIKLQGNPLASPFLWGGVVLVGLGVLGFFNSLPKVAPVEGGAA